MKLKYVVVYEKTPNNYCAYLPDLPGCISTGKTWEDIQAMIREAVAFHIEAMIEQGEPLPEKPMSVEEAMAHHCQPLTDREKETLAEYGESGPTISTTFQVVEVEVAVPDAARAG